MYVYKKVTDEKEGVIFARIQKTEILDIIQTVTNISVTIVTKWSCNSTVQKAEKTPTNNK